MFGDLKVGKGRGGCTCEFLTKISVEITLHLLIVI